ncbi:MAG: YjbQ family protein [Chitinispirillaceae bacterium]|nr:YjbQ family protein [Chitinispirillaceae bacterium]
MVKQAQVSLQTRQRAHWLDITSEVQRAVTASKIRNGTCVVASLHTTGGVTINENADPDVERDFFHALQKLVPQDPSFHHREGNSDAHVLTSLVGLSVQIPIADGTIVRGTWQSVYFCEFDGPRNRTVSVTVMGE